MNISGNLSSSNVLNVLSSQSLQSQQPALMDSEEMTESPQEKAKEAGKGERIDTYA